MLAGAGPGCNFPTPPRGGRYNYDVDSGTPLLALRIGSATHALEPGRDYVLGSADDCDLRLAGTAPRHARLEVRGSGATVVDLGSPAGTVRNGAAVTSAALATGDVLRLGDATAIVVPDDGTALLVPLPAMRQAAQARRLDAVRAKAQALRHADGQTFQQLIAEELRRAPWLAMSLLVHLLLLLLAWWLSPLEAPSGRSRVTVDIDLAADGPRGTAEVVVPEVVAEPADDFADVLQDPEPPTPPETNAAELDGPIPERREPPAQNPRLAPKQRTRTDGDGRGTALDVGGAGSGSFQQTVARLQETGLDIVFVFDSTGSMTRTILDTKSTIVEMLAVLRLLVPGARVGLVTYRDEGRREEYVVRQVPLDVDYWRATNFVQFVVAEGGGDRPEDVRAGLETAFAQPWRSSARRVVVLAGDAPPHARDVTPLLDAVQRFAKDGRSFVHTLVTSPERAGDDTAQQFAAIARAGRGVCEPLANHDRVLQRVLALAFGREFDRDLRQVIASVERECERVDVQALHLARAGGIELARALRQKPLPTEVWNALVRRPRRATTELLVDVLAAPDTPAHSREAVAAALQRIFGLQVPPIDPTTEAPPAQHRVDQLRALAAGLPH